jgi:hypothetical protein
MYFMGYGNPVQVQVTSVPSSRLQWVLDFSRKRGNKSDLLCACSWDRIWHFPILKSTWTLGAVNWIDWLGFPITGSALLCVRCALAGLPRKVVYFYIDKYADLVGGLFQFRLDSWLFIRLFSSSVITFLSGRFLHLTTVNIIFILFLFMYIEVCEYMVR